MITPQMKSSFVALLFTAGLSFGAVGCATPERIAALVPDGSSPFTLMDFADPVEFDPMTPGWYHRTFRRHAPMDISFVEKAGQSAIRLETHDSASMLFRWVDVPLDHYPSLRWKWFIETPVTAVEDERTVAGDDHPARLYLSFRSATGDDHSMEIIWGNRDLKRGDWKHLKFLGLFSFPHFVANGGNENIGRWHDEKVSLSELYATLWGDASGARLVEIALFCDTDETGARSLAYFSDVRVEAMPSPAGD